MTAKSVLTKEAAIKLTTETMFPENDQVSLQLYTWSTFCTFFPSISRLPVIYTNSYVGH